MVFVGEWLIWTVFAGSEGEEVEYAAGELSVSGKRLLWECMREERGHLRVIMKRRYSFHNSYSIQAISA